MLKQLATTLAATALVIGLGGTVFAQQGQQIPAQPPATSDQPTGGMMEGHGMMGQRGDGMMPMMGQMRQMMETCNKMMQQAMTAPQKQGG
jgi:hypothetical protein